jgi:hypothetical protein
LIDFRKVAFDMLIRPSEKIIIDGKVNALDGNAKIYIDLQYKYKGEENGDPVRKIMEGSDGLITFNKWSTFHKEVTVPKFNADSFLAFTWINGQGIMVWENLFGIMNKWNAKDRQTLRKMNAIWQQFYELYVSDSWRPYLPTNNPAVHASSCTRESTGHPP